MIRKNFISVLHSVFAARDKFLMVRWRILWTGVLVHISDSYEFYSPDVVDLDNTEIRMSSSFYLN